MTDATAVEPAVRAGARSLVAWGAVCGLAWAAALRALMAEVAGAESTVDWFGTFEGILLPGAVAGGLLGWAAHLRRTDRRRGWLMAAPLVFVLATPSVLVSVFVDGLGAGAIAVPLFGMAGGFALSGRGARWTRWTAGAFALLPVPAWLVGASLVGGRFAPDTPRGAWVAVLFLSLLAVLSFGCAMPLRTGPAVTRRRLVLVGAVCGLAWAAGLRGFMAQVAEPESTVGWATFVFILLPGAVVGGLFGRAEHLRRTGGSSRRLRLAPLVFTIDPASLAVTLPAMAGGYALAGQGSRRARWVYGACAFVPVLLYVSLVWLLDDIRELVTPLGAWTAVLLFSHLAVLTLACAIPNAIVSNSSSSSAAFPRPDVRGGMSGGGHGGEGRAAGAGPGAAAAGGGSAADA